MRKPRSSSESCPWGKGPGPVLRFFPFHWCHNVKTMDFRFRFCLQHSLAIVQVTTPRSSLFLPGAMRIANASGRVIRWIHERAGVKTQCCYHHWSQMLLVVYILILPHLGLFPAYKTAVLSFPLRRGWPVREKGVIGK